MLGRYPAVAAGCLAIAGLIFASSAGLARPGGGGGGGGGGGMHSFGGGGAIGGSMHSFGGAPSLGGGPHSFGGGMGGMHSFGAAPSFGGVRSFGGAHNLGGMHYAHPSFGGSQSHFERTHPGHFNTHMAEGNRLASRHFSHNTLARNRFEARHFAHYGRANRLARGERFNRSLTALHNGNRPATGNRFENNRGERFANAREANRSEANRFENNRFRRGNAFANAKFGGREEHRHHFRRFWAGGVFWPYFFGDYFSYAFWPDYYSDTFWDWGPDVLLWSAFWPDYEYPYWDSAYYSAEYPAQAYAGDIYGGYRRAYRTQPRRHPERYSGISQQDAAATCAGFAPGVDGLPFQQIAAIIQPAPDQQQTFDDLKAAVAKASQMLGSSCPEQAPATPVSRLDAMQQRLQAMLQAQETVRGPLERLYGMLNTEQKRRLDSAVASGERTGKGGVDLAKLCSSRAGFAKVPADDISRAITLDPQQRQDLDALIRVSDKAATMLRDTCPSTVPNTLSARLDAADARLHALINAIDTIRPEVRTFFASLTPAQKTAMNSQAPQTRTASRRH